MRRFLWAMVLPFAFLCSASANTVYTFSPSRVTYAFGINLGGDNATWSMLGANINLFGGGTAVCAQNYCSPFVPFLPGTSLTPSLVVDFEFASGTVRIGGNTYQAVLFASSITAAPFTFPMGGSVPATFTVAVPATFSVVNGMVQNTAGSSMNVLIPPSTLTLTFKYTPAGNGLPASYQFLKGQYGEITPEPSTWVLMAVGLTIIGAVTLRRSLPH